MATLRPHATGTHNGEGYDLVRPAGWFLPQCRLFPRSPVTGKLEAVYILFNEFGAQSSIVSAATYSATDETLLTRKVLFPALQQVIAQHYALRVLAVHRPSEKKPTQHIIWEAQLHKIDLERIVSFIDADDSDGLRSIVEESHNEWLDANDLTVPLWRLMVVNGRHVVFIHNHYVADGLSGYAFHDSLVRALCEKHKAQDISSVIEPPQVEPPRPWSQDFPQTLSIIRVLWFIIYYHTMRLFFASSIMFADRPIDKRSLPLSARFDKKLRCNTRLHTLRIPNEQMERILACCKAHDVTFGTLLFATSIMTAAVELYPSSKLAVTNMPFSIRPWTVPPQGRDLIMNSVATNMRIIKVDKYREAAVALGSFDSASLDRANAEKVWAVTRDYRNHFQNALKNYHLYDGMLSWKLFGPEKEVVFANVLSQYPLAMRYCISVSNLGVFDAYSDAPPDKKLAWTITDIQFSAAAIRSNWGSVAPVLNVGGVRGGDCVINCVTEDGVVEDVAMKTFLDNIEKRLRLLVHLEKN